jgi:hypothetical protein
MQPKWQSQSERGSVRGRRFWDGTSRLVIWLGALLVGCFSSSGQGITLLQTGGGQPLVSATTNVSTAGLTTPEVFFDFGFLTSETPGPGVFLDSFTVSLLDASSNVAVLATIDASGVVWAPTSPGAVFLAANQIQWQSIPPSSLSPILGQGSAFFVQLPVPTAFAGTSLTLAFDLFDNLDQQMTFGWFNNIGVAPTSPVQTPEPESGALVVLGMLMGALIKMKRSTGR